MTQEAMINVNTVYCEAGIFQRRATKLRRLRAIKLIHADLIKIIDSLSSKRLAA